MSQAAEAGAQVAPEVETPVEETPEAVEQTPATERTPSKLFRFSQHVHAGDGAEGCESVKTGACADDNHFHAWCRLPNQFQHDSIRQKALAAKARKIRQLKDPESDSHAILEADLQAIREAPGAHGWLVDDLVNREFLKNHTEAIEEINSQEEYATISEDLERLRVVDEMDEGDRNPDEYRDLQNQIEKYNRAVEDARKALEDPLRAALADKGVDDLIEQVRDERIEAEATQEFMRAYSQWEWYVCTMKPRDPAKGLPKERRWPDINVMLSEAPEALEAVDTAFSDLEAALNTAGN